MGGTIQKLPSLSPAKSAGFLNRVRRTVPKAPKVSLPAAEIKKAFKLLEGQGKSVAAIEALPGGGFRVIAASKTADGAAKPSENPWDAMLDD